MKNVIITILVILVLGLSGYLVYDKVVDKDNNKFDNEVTENNQEETNQTKTERESYEYVGNAFSGALSLDWPTDVIGKYDSDPSTVVHKIEIPKILIDTEVTKKLNNKIYNNYLSRINDLINYEDSTSRIELDITYNYTIKNNILFIMMTESVGSTRSGGGVEYSVYYYDIKNDKELSVEEVCSIFNITLDDINDESVESIYAVMPGQFNSINVFYKQNSTCPSYGCKDMKSITSKI